MEAISRKIEQQNNSLEQYTDVNEDRVLSSLSKTELQQLETELDRDILYNVHGCQGSVKKQLSLEISDYELSNPKVALPQSRNNNEEIYSFSDDEVSTTQRNVEKRCFEGQLRNPDIQLLTADAKANRHMQNIPHRLPSSINSIEETIIRIFQNDESLIEVNFNNTLNVRVELFEKLAYAMERNKHVLNLSMANVGLADRPIRALASMLKQNSSLKKLNLESNCITGDAALRLVAALRTNKTLNELRLSNQRRAFTAEVEQEIASILQNNNTLLRFGYHFTNPGPRLSINKSLTRNIDEVRKKRVKEEQKLSPSTCNTRPVLRKQSSSEWYRREKAENARKLKEQGITLDKHGVVLDDDVQKVLEHLSGMQCTLLERWFIERLFGKTEENFYKEFDRHFGKVERKTDYTSSNKESDFERDESDALEIEGLKDKKHVIVNRDVINTLSDHKVNVLVKNDVGESARSTCSDVASRDKAVPCATKNLSVVFKGILLESSLPSSCKQEDETVPYPSEENPFSSQKRDNIVRKQSSFQCNTEKQNGINIKSQSKKTRSSSVASSSLSLDPTEPRPVREDNSWITERCHRRRKLWSSKSADYFSKSTGNLEN